jgi:hypothetical protein
MGMNDFVRIERINHASQEDATKSVLAFEDLIMQAEGCIPKKLFNALLQVVSALKFIGEKQIAFAVTAGAMEYSEYLKTTHWQYVKEKSACDSDARCVTCYSDEIPLHTHHRTYSRVGMEMRNDVISLCDRCHQIFHDNTAAHMQRPKQKSDKERILEIKTSLDLTEKKTTCRQPTTRSSQ